MLALGAGIAMMEHLGIIIGEGGDERTILRESENLVLGCA